MEHQRPPDGPDPFEGLPADIWAPTSAPGPGTSGEEADILADDVADDLAGDDDRSRQFDAPASSDEEPVPDLAAPSEELAVEPILPAPDLVEGTASPTVEPTTPPPPSAAFAASELAELADEGAGQPASDLDALGDMLDQLLDQTETLPGLGAQIGRSLEMFGDRLVDGLNEIFGNRLAKMVEDLSAAVSEALVDSAGRVEELQERLDALAVAGAQTAESVALVLDRIDGGGAGAGPRDLDAQVDLVARTSGELADEVAVTRRVVERLERAGTIRRKRLDQLRASLQDLLEAGREAADRTSGELAANRAALDELNTWMGAVHTEIEEVRDRVSSEPPPPPPPPPDPSSALEGLQDDLEDLRTQNEELHGQLSGHLQSVVEELQQLRRRVAVRAKPPALDDRQVRAISDMVVNAILEAVQLESGEDTGR